jgi:hypothetical protein
MGGAQPTYLGMALAFPVLFYKDPRPKFNKWLPGLVVGQ